MMLLEVMVVRIYQVINNRCCSSHKCRGEQQQLDKKAYGTGLQDGGIAIVIEDSLCFYISRPLWSNTDKFCVDNDASLLRRVFLRWSFLCEVGAFFCTYTHGNRYVQAVAMEAPDEVWPVENSHRWLTKAYLRFLTLSLVIVLHT